MSENLDEPNPTSIAIPRFPNSVLAAGIIWIIWGCLVFANGGLHLLVHSEQGADVAGGAWNGAIGALAGALFVIIGLLTSKGAAKDTLVNGIASIAFGVLEGGYGVWLLSGAKPVLGGLGEEIVNNLLGLASVICAVGLLASGVLALQGREKYKEWRNAAS